MSRFKRIKNKSTKKSSVSIDEKIDALNKELEKTGMLSEVMTTSNVYSTSTYVPRDPGGEFPVPDPSGATQQGFTQPVSGNPDDPSNWPDAYANNDWMYNPNEVYGETNRPIFKTMDQGLIATFAAANPGNNKYPSGGAGIVFGNVAFGTGVGYIKNGHYIQVLSPGLFGNGSTNMVLPGSPYAAPYFGLFTAYRVSREEANIIMDMTGAYLDAGGYDPLNAMPVSLWRHHSFFHDGSYESYSGKKYTSEDGTRYVLSTFYLHRASNTYHENPVPEHQTNVQTRGTEDPPIYPGPIASLFGLGQRAFEWLFGRAKGGSTSSTSPKDPEDPKTTETETEQGEDEEKEKQKLLADARRIDAQNQRLADSMTSSDPRNLSAAAVTLAVGGTYIVVKSLYSLTLAAIAAGYSLYQLQQLQSDFEADFENNIVWRSNVSTKVDPFDSEATRAEKDAAFDEAQQKARERDQQDAREANQEVEKANEDLQNAKESGNETRINIAKEKLANAEKRREAIVKRNMQNKKNRRNAKEKRYEGKEKLTGKQGYTGPETFNRDNLGMFSNSFEPQGDVLSEGVALGHFEPEELNVDIEDLRKGIMPEYPKQPPAKMIDGYHEKSRIRPKNVKNEEPYLKIDKTDLIRNHRLKGKEADEMMNTINMINDHIKKHPEDLIHAQMRYPVDDPRLAELNWKMDQMLEAGSKYMDSNFKENKKLFNRAMDRTKNNIKLTDPKYVQQHYDELRGTMKSKPPINRKSPSRFFKKPVRKKSSMEEINDKIKKLDKDLLI